MSDLLVEEQFVEVLRTPDTQQVVGESWYTHKGGAMHRTNGPANFRYHLGTDKLDYVEYMQHGQLHRDEGLPAIIYYDEHSGNPSKIEFWEEGQLHRFHGPAVAVIDPITGAILSSEYHRDGVRMNPPAFEQHPSP